MNQNLTAFERLERMGCRKAGEWKLESDHVRFSLTDMSSAENVLYAFVAGKEVLYIGKTVQTLKQRMSGYQNPGPTQSTNIKANKRIKNILVNGSTVEIFALPDNGLLYYGGFHVNLAAGLEDNLVSELKPAWNESGK